MSQNDKSGAETPTQRALGLGNRLFTECQKHGMLDDPGYQTPVLVIMANGLNVEFDLSDLDCPGSDRKSGTWQQRALFLALTDLNLAGIHYRRARSLDCQTRPPYVDSRRTQDEACINTLDSADRLISQVERSTERP